MIEGGAGPAGGDGDAGAAATTPAAGPDSISPPPFWTAVTMDALALQRQQYETSAQATLAAIRSILGVDPLAPVAGAASPVGPAAGGDPHQPLRRR